jgi:D-alanyl-D-alanine carboxypeptidase/D-alanyl-D-alanine-endopeptidase (penicillin-binding protein 4)
MSGVTRRFVLGGGLAGLAGGALAKAPLTSPRPVAKALAGAPGLAAAPSTARIAAPVAADLIAAANLGGKVGYVVSDLKSGLVLEASNGAEPMPPASTAKAITSLYALEHLGSGYRFPTRLIATGPVTGGKIDGDLILAGGGDPELSTDTLGDMAADLAKTGVRGVTGRFMVWAGALPYLAEIDTGQPDWLGYNPAVSGLNLNFNRVNFVWKRSQGGYELGMDARARRFAPPVTSTRINLVDRALPVYGYSKGKGAEEWTVARGALGKGGSRWLPVRRPELYAGDVFQTLAKAAGVTLPRPEVETSISGGTVLVERFSKDLRGILRDMMKYSTNMTAEAVGMAASVRQGVTTHTKSGAAMTDWLHARAGAVNARFFDHSGLGGASRISAAEMVRALVVLGPRAGLRGLMKEIPMRDPTGKSKVTSPIRVEAKTGTLNFVSALAGYMTAPDGTDMAFAIFTGDVARRDAIPDAQRERPAGGADWVRRSKRLQQQLIERWAAVYGT